MANLNARLGDSYYPSKVGLRNVNPMAEVTERKIGISFFLLKGRYPQFLSTRDNGKHNLFFPA